MRGFVYEKRNYGGTIVTLKRKWVIMFAKRESWVNRGEGYDATYETYGQVVPKGEKIEAKMGAVLTMCTHKYSRKYFIWCNWF